MIAAIVAAAATHAAPKSSGMPQFDPQYFASQFFWLALTFGLLYFLMSRVALPRIGEVIEERRDRIQRDIDAAEKMKRDTEKALAGYEKLADARTRAGGLAKETREKLAGEGDAERHRVDAQVNAKIAEAESSIAATKTKAMSSIGEIASDIAGSIVGKLTGADASPDEVKAALQKIAGK
mgnify:CR=1 FL=1